MFRQTIEILKIMKIVVYLLTIEKFVDTISIFNRKGNSVKMNISGFAKIFHEQIDEIL